MVALASGTLGGRAETGETCVVWLLFFIGEIFLKPAHRSSGLLHHLLSIYSEHLLRARSLLGTGDSQIHQPDSA